MTVYFVTRHEGARFWIGYMSRQGYLPERVDQVVDHLDLDRIRKGDIVMGTLPINLAAEVRRRGARYRSLDLWVPAHRRGKELTATEMVAYGATLTEYRITEVERLELEPRQAKRLNAPGRPPLMISIVSAQVMPQLIALASVDAPEVLLLVTPSMQQQGGIARKLLAQHSLPDGSHPRVQQRELPEGSYSQLLEYAEALLSEQLSRGHARIHLHLTGGTKLMSQAFAQAAQGKRQVLPFYVDTSAKRIDALDTSDASQPMRAVANVRTLLEASGVSVKGAANDSPALARQLERGNLIQSLLHPKNRDFLPQWNQLVVEFETLEKKFSSRLSKNEAKNFQPQHIDDRVDPRGLEFNLLPTSRLRRALGGPIGKRLVEAGVLHPIRAVAHNQSLPLAFTSRHELAFLKGGWLEIHVARLMQATDVDDWGLSVEVKGERQNELDLVAACGNRLLFIETKTNRQIRKGPEGDNESVATKALYKFTAVSGRLANLFEERWYVSSQPLDAVDLARAAHFNVKVFMGGEFPPGLSHVRPLAELPDALKDWVDRYRLERAASLRPSVWPALSQNWRDGDGRQAP